MLSPKFPRVLRYLLIALVPAVAALVTGCPFGDQTGSNGDSPGQPVPPDDIELEVTIEGQGTVEQEADGSYVTLTAVPDAGWYFEQWLGTTVSKHNPLTVQATEDTSISALFLEIEPPVTAVCGDDAVNQESETCDGTDMGNTACTSTSCRAPGAAAECTCCGDGSVNGGEDCDDGNTVAGDGCEDCTVTAFCGDDTVNQGSETCDGTDMGDAVCTECRDPGAAAECTCCGDGEIDGDEECDDENKVAGDGCENDCTLTPICGDNTVNRESETCDGTDMGNTACTSCRASGTADECTCCGDDEVNGGEDCDPPDASTCDSTCKFIPPDNDDCDDAIDIGDGDHDFSNERAGTDGPDEPDLCDFSGYTQLGADVWFCYEATCNGDLSVNLCDSNYDTKVAVYAGCTCPSADPKACDEDGCGTEGAGSEVTFDVSKDADYLIRVGGFNADEGSGTLTITCQAAGPQCQSNSDCDDGVFCNGTETCVGGNCQGGSAPCADAAHCDEENHECLECLVDGECDDDNLCTNDACVDNDCQNIAVQCDAGEVCDPGTGQCVQTCSANPDCDDVLFCNGAETCVNEMCQDGTAPCIDQAHCDEDNDLCLDCISNGECDDGDLCTEDECIDNECQYTDKECPPGEYCNPATGTCVECLNADHCDDDNKCTIDSCDLNVCQHTDVNCGAGLVCDPDTGDCVECLVADHCDDGDLCTEDNCVDKVCENNPKLCGPNEECDPATGDCVTVCDLNEDCDDSLFCNGQEVCVERRCTTLDPPCIDDNHCDEENDRCLECLSADECDDGDLCTDDDCTPQNECLNIDVQCAPGVCNPDTGECVDCLVNADCQNGLFCDGDEGCSPALECQPGEDPCDDGINCTIDICYELNDSCENAATGARCPDDELFCNGEEYCNPVSDCTSTGDPCQADETCNEELDRCEVEPVIWVSTQLLFPGFPGYKAPESHELDGVRDLVVAHLGLSEDDLLLLFDEVTVLATSVPIGVETEMYRAVRNPGDPLLEESIEQSVTITTFHLSIRGSTPTWTFDYIVVEDVKTPMGETLESRQFFGTQTGDITANRDEITWTSVDGSFQRCIDGNCGPEKPLEELIPTGDWILGTWTKQE